MQSDVSNILEATPEERGRAWYTALIGYKARVDQEPVPEEATSNEAEDVHLGVDDHPGDQPGVSIPPPSQPAGVPPPSQPAPSQPPAVPQQPPAHAPPPSDYITRAEMVSMLANTESRLMAHMVSLWGNMESRLMAQIDALREEVKAYTDKKAEEEVRMFSY